MSEIVNLEQKNSETPVNSVNTNKNTIQLEVYYFSSSGSMIDFAQSPASREVGKSGPVLLMFNDRIYYMVDMMVLIAFPRLHRSSLLIFSDWQDLKITSRLPRQSATTIPMWRFLSMPLI